MIIMIIIMMITMIIPLIIIDNIISMFLPAFVSTEGSLWFPPRKSVCGFGLGAPSWQRSLIPASVRKTLLQKINNSES